MNEDENRKKQNKINIKWLHFAGNELVTLRYLSQMKMTPIANEQVRHFASSFANENDPFRKWMSWSKSQMNEFVTLRHLSQMKNDPFRKWKSQMNELVTLRYLSQMKMTPIANEQVRHFASSLDRKSVV